MNPATNMTDDWIKRALTQNPCAAVTRDGVPTGDYRTCPVRLSFSHVITPGRNKFEGEERGDDYGTSLLFWPGADVSVLKLAAGECAKAKWPKAGTPEGPKIRSPFLLQDEDCERYIGYQPGGVLIRATSDRKRPVVDQNLAPIIEQEQVHSGVWAICTLRPFAYDKSVNKGVSFGLQAVMLLADDQDISGSSTDLKSAFEGVKIDANLNPSALFGAEGPTAGGGETTAADLFN